MGLLQFSADKIHLSDADIIADFHDICDKIRLRGAYATDITIEDCVRLPYQFIEFIKAETRVESLSIHSCHNINRCIPAKLAAIGLRTLIIFDSPELEPCINTFFPVIVRMNLFKYVNADQEFTYSSYYTPRGYLLVKNIRIGSEDIGYIKYTIRNKKYEYGTWNDYRLIREGKLVL